MNWRQQAATMADMVTTTYLVPTARLAEFLDSVTTLFEATNLHRFHGFESRTLRLKEVTVGAVMRGKASARNDVFVLVAFDRDEEVPASWPGKSFAHLEMEPAHKGDSGTQIRRVVSRTA